MTEIKTEYYTDPNTFFTAVRQYAADIGGFVLNADQVPYVGFVVYRESKEDEKSKYFLLDCKYLRDAALSEIIFQAMKSNKGKKALAKFLENVSSDAKDKPFVKPKKNTCSFCDAMERQFQEEDLRIEQETLAGKRCPDCGRIWDRKKKDKNYCSWCGLEQGSDRCEKFLDDIKNRL
jgi:hypothetical protein